MTTHTTRPTTASVLSVRPRRLSVTMSRTPARDDPQYLSAFGEADLSENVGLKVWRSGKFLGRGTPSRLGLPPQAIDADPFGVKTGQFLSSVFGLLPSAPKGPASIAWGGSPRRAAAPGGA